VHGTAFVLEFTKLFCLCGGILTAYSGVLPPCSPAVRIKDCIIIIIIIMGMGNAGFPSLPR
jgi:hypothetical protein